MGLEEFKISLNEEIEQILSTDFKIIVKETDTVPSIDDSDITYPNLVTMEQKCKLLETCVLYIDIRKSTDLNLNHRRETMAKLYSSFVRSMAKAGSYYGGKVRNVIGDRLMIVFDKENCFKNAYDTAVLMNSVSQYVLNKHFRKNDIECGIGIDYGKMLVSKAGIKKNGSDNTPYKSLVWLGRPANVASKLTDLANKTITNKFTVQETIVKQGFHYPLINDWAWVSISASDFLENKLEKTYTRNLRHVDEYFTSFFTTTEYKTVTKQVSSPPIIMTKYVYEGLKKSHPDIDSFKKNWLKEVTGLNVPGYNEKVYGSSVYLLDFNK